VGAQAAVSAAICAIFSAGRVNGIRDWLTNSVDPKVRCSTLSQRAKQLTPLQPGVVRTARRAAGFAASSSAIKGWRRRARASCSAHQVRPKITRTLAPEVPEVLSSSISPDCSSSVRSKRRGRKSPGEWARSSAFVMRGKSAGRGAGRAKASRQSSRS